MLKRQDEGDVSARAQQGRAPNNAVSVKSTIE